MGKTNITVTYDADKVSATKMYMAQKELSFEDEMEKAVEMLYGKYVPAGVRAFIEMRAGAKPSAGSRKPKQSPPSVVDVVPIPDGDSD